MIPIPSTAPTNGSTPDPDQIIHRSLNESVQNPPQIARDGSQSSGAAWGWGLEPVQRSALLPARGTRAREAALKRLYFMEELGMIQGAFVGVAKAIASLGWEIKA